MLPYKLEGAMYTASPDATEDELNQRIPLSIARWHRRLNFCQQICCWVASSLMGAVTKQWHLLKRMELPQ
jgi:hypothetical protein